MSYSLATCMSLLSVLQFASYAESQSAELARSVYNRACTIHLQRKPNIHVAWAMFEEKQGGFISSLCCPCASVVVSVGKQV